MRKKIAIVALVIGIALSVFGLVKQTNDNTVFKLGDAEIERSREHNINWMMIAGIAITVGGLIMFVIPVNKG